MEYTKVSETEIKLTTTEVREEVKSLISIQEDKNEIERKIANLESDIARYTSTLTAQIDSLRLSLVATEEVITVAKGLGIVEVVPEEVVVPEETMTEEVNP